MAKPDGEDARDCNRFLPVGTVLRGKYRIDGVIGTGGMAVVYAATHRNRKRFAVKMLHPEVSAQKEVRARFIREGYVANSVEHPGVVSVLDDDVTEEGSPFLVMELLEGATIEEFSPRSQPLPLRETLSIAHDVLGVLDAAHEKRIIHRDIKPANLFLTRQGELKVLDFGIARLRDANLAVAATGAGTILGTPAFMAPEQALAMASEIDARTDLWAVGATVFTMLSGCLVHDGDNARQVMVHAATEPARSLASVAADLPEAVIEWVDQALRFDKNARWQSAALMREAVARLHQQLFGDFEGGEAKRLFESRTVAARALLGEGSPAGALHSAVHETTRSLQSAPVNPVVSPSPPVHTPPARARARWVPLTVLGVAVMALGVGVAPRFVGTAQHNRASASAALTSPSAFAAPLASFVAVARPSASAIPAVQPPPAVMPSAPTVVVVPAASGLSRASAPALRARAPKRTASEAALSTPRVAPRSTVAAPPLNPLQIEIQ